MHRASRGTSALPTLSPHDEPRWRVGSSRCQRLALTQAYDAGPRCVMCVVDFGGVYIVSSVLRTSLLPGLASCRAAAGLTQTELARLASLTPESICRFERQRRAAGMGAIQRLAAALNVSIATLNRRPDEPAVTLLAGHVPGIATASAGGGVYTKLIGPNSPTSWTIAGGGFTRSSSSAASGRGLRDCRSGSRPASPWRTSAAGRHAINVLARAFPASTFAGFDPAARRDRRGAR